ncbi:MAG: hypothetical protein OXC25_03890 [Thiotrichales bacterium]|nr:hypothetical protein [Thiotrichales bacterium]
MAIAASLGLAGCGGSSDNDEGTNPPDSTTPTPVDATADIKLSKAQSAALKADGILPDNGDSFTLENVGEGDDGVTRVGVTFTCASAYPCSVRVENSGGTIVATAHSQRLPTGTVSGAAAGLARDRVDTFARLNDGSTPAIRRDVIGAAADSGTVPPNLTPTEFTGMGIGGPGVLPEDAEAKGGLRSDFQANGGRFTDDAGADLDPQPAAGADPGVLPTLRGGTTISVAVAPDGDRITPSPDMAPAPDGWSMRTLFRDWGDTSDDSDGGFETGAIIVTNLGEGTAYPFDRKLADKYVNDRAKRMFELTIRANGGSPSVVSLATSVHINPAGSTTLAEQWAAMVFDSTSLVAAQDQDRNVDVSETFTGTYFGARGKFQCLGANGGANCGLMRNEDGTVVVVDQVAGSEANQTGIQNGRWSFTPDPDAMITVPDQDWIAYGAWLTTPDQTHGDHRLGVLFNGMDLYAPAPVATTSGGAIDTNAFNPIAPDGLRGSATYKGGATGIYVDGGDSGLFTANASLTAHFDKDSTAADNGTTDYTISGRIDNFRGTDGAFLGDDTEASPNDPEGGGENDWVVLLQQTSFVEDGTVGSIVAPTDAAGTNTGGSADGVPWSGKWNGRLFGPSVDADGDPTPPSGVAGQFWAEIDDTTPTDADTGPTTAVVGSFGANKQ